jgi:elongation factor 1-beta
MGKVSILFEVMPDGVEVDLKNLEKVITSDLKGLGDLQAIQEKPIAFGLKALMVNVLVDDAEGVMDRLEEKLGSIKNVQSAKVVSMGRL